MTNLTLCNARTIRTAFLGEKASSHSTALPRFFLISLLCAVFSCLHTTGCEAYSFRTDGCGRDACGEALCTKDNVGSVQSDADSQGPDATGGGGTTGPALDAGLSQGWMLARLDAGGVGGESQRPV